MCPLTKDEVILSDQVMGKGCSSFENVLSNHVVVWRGCCWADFGGMKDYQLGCGFAVLVSWPSICMRHMLHSHSPFSSIGTNWHKIQQKTDTQISLSNI
jgi:hypothetical protein